MEFRSVPELVRTVNCSVISIDERRNAYGRLLSLEYEYDCSDKIYEYYRQRYSGQELRLKRAAVAAIEATLYA